MFLFCLRPPTKATQGLLARANTAWWDTPGKHRGCLRSWRYNKDKFHAIFPFELDSSAFHFIFVHDFVVC